MNSSKEAAKLTSTDLSNDVSVHEVALSLRKVPRTVPAISVDKKHSVSD